MRRRSPSTTTRDLRGPEKLGHEAFYHTSTAPRQSLTHSRPSGADLYFNLTESYAGDDTKDMHVAAYLDLLGSPTPAPGRTASTSRRTRRSPRRSSRSTASARRRSSPAYRGRLDRAHDIHFPVIVKPASEDGSIGIRFSAVVGSLKELMERIDQVHADFDGPALIEEYIEGREIYVACSATRTPRSLPIVELDLSQLPEGTPRIAGTEVKWEEGTEVYRVTQPAPADDLDEDPSKPRSRHGDRRVPGAPPPRLRPHRHPARRRGERPTSSSATRTRGSLSTAELAMAREEVRAAPTRS